MPSLSSLRIHTRRPFRSKWMLLATAMVAIAMILLLTIILQHQFESIRWALDNVRGAFAADSSCQPACRSMLLRWLKRALPGH